MTTILAVDDSATMRKCLEIAFAGTEFTLVTCDSAIAALEKVKTIQPALVIADVSLPPGDGYELCTTIKLAAPGLPVLMLTSKQNPFDAARGAQADDHIDKPFDTQALFDKAREMVKERTVGDDAVRPPQRPPSVRPVPLNAPVARAHGDLPGRRRPTPAMLSAMREPAKRQPPDQLRRTVPFAVPSPVMGQSPAMAAMSKTNPGVAPEAATPSPGPVAGGVRKPADLSRTMAFGAEDFQRPGLPRQALARGADLPPPERPALPLERPVPLERPAPERPTDPSMPVTKTGGTLPGVAGPEGPPAVQQSAASAAVARNLAGNGNGFHEKLEGLGLSREQVDGVLALSREVIEQVVWEVVPTLAETIIKEELRRLTRE